MSKIKALILFAAASVAAFSSPARAVEPVTPTIATVSSTETISGIAISTSVPTSVVISTQSAYRQVCVQNVDASNLSCGENVSVSTITTSSLAGVVVPTATPILSPTCFSIVPGSNFYCLSWSTTAATRAVIIRGR